MIRSATIAVLLLMPLGASGASAEEMNDCTTAPQSDWLSEDAVRAKAVELGYDVRDVKVEGGCYEIYALKDGERVELVANPSTGEIVGDEAGEE